MTKANESIKKHSTSRYLLAGCLSCGIILIFFIAVCVGGYLWLINSLGGEGGVRLQNNFEQYALDYIETNKILNIDEEMLAYYDGSIMLTGEELLILTDKRIIDRQYGQTSAISLEEIEDIQHYYDSLQGDTFVVTSKSGETMQFEIDIYNDGDLFLEIFMDTWNKAKE